MRSYNMGGNTTQAVLCPLRAFTLNGWEPTISAMDTLPDSRPIHGVRWRNFRRLLAWKEVTLTAAADTLGKSQGQVSHFGGKKPTKVIGDQIAEEIEAAFALPAGSMDIEQAEGEPFSPVIEPSQNHDDRHSRPARLRPDILAQAVEVITADEALNGLYSPLRHAETLLALYGRLEAGESPLRLVAEVTRQRAQGETNAGEQQQAGNHRN